MENSAKKTAAPIIEVKDMTAGYGSTAIQKNLNFNIPKGEIFIILGGSGCGKSTVLKHMIGLNPPLEGDILIEGKSIVNAQGRDRTAILRRIGVAFQSGALFGSLTLTENICLPLKEYTALAADAQRLIAWMRLKLVGLDGFENYLPNSVSGGMQKRAALARAMALDPAVLFLDEPSAGLDPITSAGLDQLILDLRDMTGMTFVIVTHELPSIYAIADRVIMLDKETKSIIAEGKPADLRDHSTDPFVRQFFHRDAKKTNS